MRQSTKDVIGFMLGMSFTAIAIGLIQISGCITITNF